MSDDFQRRALDAIRQGLSLGSFEPFPAGSQIDGARVQFVTIDQASKPKPEPPPPPRVRVFLEETGELVLELTEIKGSNRVQQGKHWCGAFRGDIATHDIDRFPMDGAKFRVIDDCAGSSVVLTGCVVQQVVAHSFTRCNGAPKDTRDLEFVVHFERVMSYSRWSELARQLVDPVVDEHPEPVQIVRDL